MQTTDSSHGHDHAPGASARPSESPERLPGIRDLIAVGSGKGGVGKSTVSVNLALSLQHVGGRIGLLDADLFGPSIPGMLGLPTGQQPEANQDGRMHTGRKAAHSLLMILARSRIETTPTTASASITWRCRNSPESI